MLREEALRLFQREDEGLGPIVIDHESLRAALATPSSTVQGYFLTRPKQAPGRAGGRITVDNPNDVFSFIPLLLAPGHPDEAWKVEDLEDVRLTKLPPARLVQILTDVSPEINRALWDYNRLCNSGWEVKAYYRDSSRQHAAAQAVIDTFLGKLRENYGSTNTVVNRIFTTIFLRGAIAGEIVLDPDGRTAVDLALPDPFTFRFKRKDDQIRGRYWGLFQVQGADWVDLDGLPTVRYIPVDPFPNIPYGRPLATPALFATTFLIGMLHDLRRVVAQQGYPRLHVKIDTEKLTPPEGATIGTTEWADWVNDIIADVKATYQSMMPDEAYVSADFVSIDRPVGTMDTASLGAIGELLRALERMLIRALKTMPLLMGSNESVSETHANRQWEVMVAGIKTVQMIATEFWTHMLQLALRAAGIQADIAWQFEELRASEELRDQQTFQLKLDNAFTAYALGYASQQEAAMNAVGHFPDAPEPRLTPNGFVSGMAAPPSSNIANPEPAAGREAIEDMAERLGERFERALERVQPPAALPPPERNPAVDALIAAVRDIGEGLSEMAEAVAAQVPPVVNVNVPEREPAVVNLTVPEAAPPVVNVTLPDTPPPVVNVTTAAKPRREWRRVERDEEGNLLGIVTEREP